MLKYKEYMSSISQKIFITTKIEKKETKDDFNIKTYDVKVMTFCVGERYLCIHSKTQWGRKCWKA